MRSKLLSLNNLILFLVKMEQTLTILKITFQFTVPAKITNSNFRTEEREYSYIDSLPTLLTLVS